MFPLQRRAGAPVPLQVWPGLAPTAVRAQAHTPSGKALRWARDRPEARPGSVLGDQGRDHPWEGVVAALGRRGQLHQLRADILAPEACLQQRWHLGLLAGGRRPVILGPWGLGGHPGCPLPPGRRLQLPGPLGAGGHRSPTADPQNQEAQVWEGVPQVSNLG